MSDRSSADLVRDPIMEATKLISKMQISSNTVMTSNKKPGILGGPMVVQSNAFGVIVERENSVYVHDIRIFADLPSNKTVEFTKKGKDDCLVNERKEKCVSVVKAVLEQNKDIFPDPYQVYYDGQSLLFSLKNITNENFKRFTVVGKDLEHPELQGLELIIMELKASSSKPFFTLSAEALCSQTANLDLSDNNQLITQFIEIAINQHAIMTPTRHKVYEHGKTFMMHPSKEGLQQSDCKDVGDGKHLLVGTKKSVRQIEGPRGRGTNNSALVIDAMKAAFHDEQNLLEKARIIIRHPLERPLQEGERDRVNGVIKGLFVETLHLKNNKRIQLHGLSKGNSVDSFFEKDGKRVSIAQYFIDKYSIHLKAPNAPLVLVKERGIMNVYPMEVLKVVPWQRVTIPQQTPEQSQQSTRECAVPPIIRQRYIMAGATALEVLNPQNLYIKNAGLKVFPNPIKVNGRILPSPVIAFAGNRSEPVDLGKWRTRNQKYLIPAECEVWAAYLMQDKRTNFSVQDMQQFARKYFDECGRRGMKLKPPAEIRLIGENDLEGVMKGAASHGCQFVLVVVADLLVNVHKNLKYWERKYEMVTQQVKVSNMEKIMREGKVMTLENIINKSNCKLGGLNYGLDLSAFNGIAQNWFTNERIIVGVSISHPPPSAAFSSASSMPPSVVGFAANMKSSPFEFIGDFMFQDTRKCDTLYCMRDIIEQVVKRHAASHNNVPAKELVIYRNGIDEGSFSAILTKEIPLIKAVLMNMGFSMKIAFIVAAKTNSDIRLFRENIDPREKPTMQNVMPGVVCDTQLVHPAFCEFYLNSHTTLQGSASTPRYTVLVDELDMSSDQVEGMTYALAHNHQIVALTTSLPCNVYIAHRYAERGQALYSEYIAKEESSSENSSGFDDATRLLTFNLSKIGNARVNA